MNYLNHLSIKFKLCTSFSRHFAIFWALVSKSCFIDDFLKNWDIFIIFGAFETWALAFQTPLTNSFSIFYDIELVLMWHVTYNETRCRCVEAHILFPITVFSSVNKMDRREGHGAMVRAWRSADVAACRAVLNPAWCRIFREISFVSPLNLVILLRCCVLGQGTSPSNASLDSGENEYLVRQRWQRVR